MLSCSIIDVDKDYNISLNISILSGYISFFHFATRILYIRKNIITQTTISDRGLSRNGSHK